MHGFTPATEGGGLKDRVAADPPACDGACPPSIFGVAAPIPVRLSAAHIRPRVVARGPAASTLVRPTHELHGVFDMPPGFCQFLLALRFKVDSVPGSFRDGLGAMRFQQLSRIVMDFDFSHGVMLLSFCAGP
jgi:hypothetical protein